MHRVEEYLAIYGPKYQGSVQFQAHPVRAPVAVLRHHRDLFPVVVGCKEQIPSRRVTLYHQPQHHHHPLGQYQPPILSIGLVSRRR